MSYIDTSYIALSKNSFLYEASIVTILVAADCKQGISLACFAQLRKGSAEAALLLALPRLAWAATRKFDFEIGYSFTIPEHTRPDPDNGAPIEYNPIEYNTVGGMTWSSDGWTVGGLNSKWGPDVH